MSSGTQGWERYVVLAGAALGPVGLLLVHRFYGYTLFHVLVELFAVVVAAGIFIVTWNTRRLLDNGYLLVLGIAFLFVGGVDLLHTLAYKGMGDLLGHDHTDVPTQLWLVARYLQAGAMLVAPAFLTRRVRPYAAMAFSACVTVLGVSAVLWWDVFPVALDPVTGLTPFKVGSEYLISSMLGVAALALWRNRERFEAGVLRLLLGSILVTIASEMAFTLYTDPFGALNFVGHLLKVLAFFLIYKAIVESALRRPFGVLFREAAEREAALAESEERFRTTFEQATVGIAHLDLDGRWLRVNERLAEIAGYPTEELLRRSFKEITHPDDLPADLKRMSRLLAGEICEYCIEKRLVRKDGQHTWVSLRRSLLREADGSPKYFVSIIEDISERRSSEERLRRAKELSEALNRVDAAINSTLDFRTIMRRAVVSAAAGVGCETASVMLREEGCWVPIVTHEFPAEIIGRPFPDEELPQAVLAAELGVPVAISNAYDDDRVNREVMRRYEIRSVLVVPLISRGDCVGSIYFNFHSHTHWFTPDESDFATSLASALALAIENSRLYDAQRTIAETLQAALMAMPDRLPRVDFAGAYRSSGDPSSIGGDFYDAFVLGPARIAFTLGDVSGKGLAAATVTAIARSTLRAFAYRDSEPARVLAEANAVLVRQMEEDRFVTALCGVLDTSSGLLTLSTAGHPPPLLCGPEHCGYLEVPANPPLGLFAGIRFEEVSVRLGPGEMIVAYSDGMLDARGESGFFGEKRLLRLLTDLATEPAEELVARAIAAVESFTGGVLTDDAAIAAFRLTAANLSLVAEQPTELPERLSAG
ncbi:MAG: SpoIIE family protein phosphatase [Coriobacteriia bacterium]|nr:SpoIIE family protein phosphatase [Coriobacteriia bacterium]